MSSAVIVTTSLNDVDNVKPQTLFFAFCLLLPALNISAGDVSLMGTGDPETSKVYIVQLRSPSAAEHYASLTKKGMATSMAGDKPMPRFEKKSAAVQSYAARLDNEQQIVLSTTGPNTSKIYSYKYGLNGFAARMSVAEALKLERHPDVLNVWEDEVRPMATQYSPLFLGLFDFDGGLRSQHGLDGDGIVIGIIDSGIAPEHPALKETRDSDRPSSCQQVWAETTILGRWLCRRFTKLPDVLDFEEPEDRLEDMLDARGRRY
jgi:hypothetical protein